MMLLKASEFMMDNINAYAPHCIRSKPTTHTFMKDLSRNKNEILGSKMSTDLCSIIANVSVPVTKMISIP